MAGMRASPVSSHSSVSLRCSGPPYLCGLRSHRRVKSSPVSAACTSQEFAVRGLSCARAPGSPTQGTRGSSARHTTTGAIASRRQIHRLAHRLARVRAPRATASSRRARLDSTPNAREASSVKQQEPEQDERESGSNELAEPPSDHGKRPFLAAHQICRERAQHRQGRCNAGHTRRRHRQARPSRPRGAPACREPPSRQRSRRAVDSRRPHA